MSKELTSLEALNEIKKQIGNIHYFDFSSNLPRETSIELRNTELFTTIENALKDFEWLKSKISIDWFEKLQTDDKFRVMKIMGVEYDETYTK